MALLGSLVASGEEGEGFHAPSISEFFPGELIFAGTPFAMTRINLIGMLMAGLLSLFFVMAFRENRLVPKGIQNLGELAVETVEKAVILEVMGEKGRKYAPYLVSMFFLLFAFNITGVVPFMHISATSVMGPSSATSSSISSTSVADSDARTLSTSVSPSAYFWTW